MNCRFEHMIAAYLTDDLAAAPRARFEEHLDSCVTCAPALSWERKLLHAAGRVGSTLQSRPLGRRSRWRPRHGMAIAALFLLAAGVSFLVTVAGSDPAADIEAQYADLDRMEQLLERSDWDAAGRAAYREALTKIDHAIEAAKEAVRTCPTDPVHVELCHMAYQAKERLLKAHLAVLEE